MIARRLLATAALLALVALPLAAQQEARSDAPRDDAPVDAETLARLVGGNSDFACDLYRVLADDGDGNVFVSPHSITSALAMTAAGARGETANQMRKALRLAFGGARLHRAMNGLDRALLSRGADVPRTGEGHEGFRLSIVNQLWGQIGIDFEQDFLDLLASQYGAGMILLDFARDADGSRRTINAAIERDTENRIKDLLQPPDVPPSTRLILTNAIYFKASWLETFKTEWTREAPFHRLDGTQVDAPLMSKTEEYLYGEGEGLQAIELPYHGAEVSMLVLLPAAGRLGALEASLSAATLDDIVAGLEHREVYFRMPRFETKARYRLREVLGEMGMKVPFQPGRADFSGIDGGRDLFIGDVVHQTFVKVDESGTEAAAATAVVMKSGGEPPEPVEMRCDRPFVYIIRDRATGAILFIGRVTDPS